MTGSLIKDNSRSMNPMGSEEKEIAAHGTPGTRLPISFIPMGSEFLGVIRLAVETLRSPGV